MSLFLDIVMLAVAAALAFMGARRGFIGEVFRLAAMIGGFFIAFIYYGDLQTRLLGINPNAQFAAAVAFLLIYVAAFFAIVGIGQLLRKFIKLAMLGWLDCLLGITVGLLKAALMAWAVCLSISSLPVKQIHDQFGKSIVYKTFTAVPKGLTLDGLEKMKGAIRGKSGKGNDKGEDDGNNRRDDKGHNKKGIDVINKEGDSENSDKSIKKKKAQSSTSTDI